MSEIENGENGNGEGEKAPTTRRRRSATAAAAPTAERALSSYVIMKRVAFSIPVEEGEPVEGIAWQMVGEQQAHSRSQARDKFVEAQPEGHRSGVFKAVAATSWIGGSMSYQEQQVLAVTTSEVED